MYVQQAFRKSWYNIYSLNCGWDGVTNRVRRMVIPRLWGRARSFHEQSMIRVSH